MSLDAVFQSAPDLVDALNTLSFVADSESLWQALRRLLLAPAPSGGAGLAGAILDDIAAIARSLDLGDRFVPYIGSTGNAAIWLGADKPTADLIVIAHMDRPSYKVRSAEDGALYPICAVRFPQPGYHVPARSLRFENGKLIVGARGQLIYEQVDGRETFHLHVDSGALSWQDTVVMEVEPTLVDGLIMDTGLDNCLGVVTVLGVAAALRLIEPILRALDRRVLFVFSDLEEGIPDAYFGHGAARLTYAIPPPTYGCIVVDAQTVSTDSGLALGQGAAHGTVSGWSRGSFVAPNYLALAIDLAKTVNGDRQGTVQMNRGYLSRSDDMALGRWTRILGMIGPPMTDPHTGEEPAYLSDVQSAMWWLACYAATTLIPTSDTTAKYALA